MTGFTYLTPRWGSNKFVRNVLGDWAIGGILRYASGHPIQAPSSNNNLFPLIFQSTRMNRVPGQLLFLKDPNCGRIDPRQELVLNPAAWVDAPPGQFATAPGFYSDYRWRRQVSENMSLGRRFTIKEKVKFDVRAEFFNLFNRLNLPAPTSGNPRATITRNQAGELNGGFGFINPNNVVGQRNGQLVARIEF